MYRWLRVPAAGAIALAVTLPLLVAPPVHGAQTPVTDAQANGHSIGCTVKRLRIDEGRLEVIVGVGYALRIVGMELSTSCGASARGQHIPLEEIQPGDSIQVRYET